MYYDSISTLETEIKSTTKFEKKIKYLDII
jgi:hypothetical protein